MRKAGRSRYLQSRADEITSALQSEQLEARPGIEAAYTATTKALVAVIAELNNQIQTLQGQVEECIGRHPDAEIYLSQPGLGPVLGARVLAEFGDAPHRYADARARENYSGMSPITRASGKKSVVLARHARNRRLGDALYGQAFAALNASPGAREYYAARRARGATHRVGPDQPETALPQSKAQAKMTLREGTQPALTSGAGLLGKRKTRRPVSG